MVAQRRATKKQTPNGFGHGVQELIALGLEVGDAYKLVNWINRLLRRRGPIGARALLDSMESVYKSYFYDLPVPVTPVWVARTASGIPRKVAFLRNYPRRVQKRLIPLKRLLQVDAVNETNINKWHKAATRKPVERSKLSSVHEIISRGAKRMRLNHSLPTVATSPKQCKSALELYYLKTAAKSALDALHVHRCSLAMLSDIQQVAYTHLASNPYIHEACKPLDTTGGLHVMLERLLNSNTPISDYAMSVPFDRHPTSVGSIFASSEPGCKLRIFASPRLLYQAALTPLFGKLWEILAILPTDCTHTQTAGAEWALEQLRQGKTVYSVDLSNATDNFPYELSRELIKRMGFSQSLVEILDFVASGHWCLPHSWGKGNYVQWTVGQPLGLLPSFGLFALTHNALLYGLCDKLKLYPTDHFRILGDDVIITHPQLNAAYRQVLRLLEVEISEAKSFTSDHYAEFAGYNIHPKEGLTRPGKFRPLSPQNLETKLKDKDYVAPQLLLPKYSHRALTRFLTAPYPFGVQDLTDEMLSQQDSEWREAAFAKIVAPLRMGRIDLHSLLWKVSFELFHPILQRQVHDLSLTCKHALQTIGNGPDSVTITDPEHWECANTLLAEEWQLYDRYARVVWEILHNDNTPIYKFIDDEPLIKKGLGYQEARSRVHIINALINTYPLGALPCVGDKWLVLRRINRFIDAKEVSLTPRSLTRYWREI
jgi:hypothetical protein